jgi:hypothetical protein
LNGHTIIDIQPDQPDTSVLYSWYCCTTVKRDLEIPSSVSKFISLCLLFSIGIKGGQVTLGGQLGTMVDMIIPIKSSNSLDGWDSILSILQMLIRMPEGTVALNGSKNAGLPAIQILSAGKKEYREKVIAYKASFNQ